MSDLPHDFPWNDVVIKITGNQGNSFSAYWVVYDGTVWKEYRDPTRPHALNAGSMPHIIERDTDASGDTIFTVKPYEWDERLVGDEDTSPDPLFLGKRLQDIFFFKNRLCFITTNSVAMSEVGFYGNLFPTTVMTTLDSDPIDIIVDSNQNIRLEYAIYLEDAMMLFGDKQQFKLQGGDVLSPTNVQVTIATAYNIARNVRPIYIDDRVIFCANRGQSMGVYEFRTDREDNIESAFDITSHVQNFIPNDVFSMAGSSSSSMLFFLSHERRDRLYVYKYLEDSGKKMQSAWFTWDFNAQIMNIFVLGCKLYLILDRYESTEADGGCVTYGVW